MAEAAHPQRDDAGPVGSGTEPDAPPPADAAKNPFPTSMTVPGFDGGDVTVELAVVGGVLYAPGLADLPLSALVRQYVTQYCAAWSGSVLTVGMLGEQWPHLPPPRRGQLVFRESQLHAMIGLAPDERLVRVVLDELSSTVRFVVESPRLPPQPGWDCEPPIIGLPVAVWYEDSEAPR